MRKMSKDAQINANGGTTLGNAIVHLYLKYRKKK